MVIHNHISDKVIPNAVKMLERIIDKRSFFGTKWFLNATEPPSDGIDRPLLPPVR
jgi:hypothetical protein